MYLPIQSQQTCAQAWLAAVMLRIIRKAREAYNVIVDIEESARTHRGR